MIGNPQRPPVLRKIDLDPSEFKIFSQRMRGGDRLCDHDWLKTKQHGEWRCELCSMIATFEAWK